MLLHICICVCLCIYIVHYIRGRQVDKLSVHCDLRTNSFLHELFLQFDFSALPCLTAEVRQCVRYIVSIVCFTVEILVSIKRYFLTRTAILPSSKKKKIFSKYLFRFLL